jgi:hypothetical protein
MPQTTPKSLSYGFHILNYGAAVRPNDSHCTITRKYWDHLRQKIILGPLAYLKFPPFHDHVKASKLGTHPEKPRYLLPIRFRYVLIIVRFRRSFCHRKQFLIPGLKDETSYIVCFQKRCCYQGYLVLITGGDLEERKQSVV